MDIGIRNKETSVRDSVEDIRLEGLDLFILVAFAVPHNSLP